MQQSARAELAEQRLAEILGMDPTIATVAQAFRHSHSYVSLHDSTACKRMLCIALAYCGTS